MYIREQRSGYVRSSNVHITPPRLPHPKLHLCCRLLLAPHHHKIASCGNQIRRIILSAYSGSCPERLNDRLFVPMFTWT
jgi:hypothetical protein